MTESTSLPISSIQKRISAFVIDDIVVSIFFLIIFYDQISNTLSNITVLDQASMEAVNVFIAENIIVVFLIKILYHTILIWQNGMTFGKYIMKIRTVDLDTEMTPSFYKAFLRAILRLGSEVFFYFGFLLAFVMPLKQTFHDKLSNCVVIDA
jgi:uncharacterized RDD family membrane protein YckC